MGYWISHYIRASGNQEDVDAYTSKLTQRRPKKLTDDGDIVWSEEEFSFYNITPPPEEMIQSGDWWGDAGNMWRAEHWECYDAPADEVDTFTNAMTNTVATIRLSTKYEWPIKVFEELVRKYPNLEFYIWSEGEESEAVEISGSYGTFTTTKYETPNSHADWDARDNVDSCWCANYDDPTEWYEDCPKDEPTFYKVSVIHTHYVKANTETDAKKLVEAYDNGFDKPEYTEMIKYCLAPQVVVTEEEEEVK